LASGASLGGSKRSTPITIFDQLKNAAEEVTGGFKEDQLAFGKARIAALRKNFGRGPKAPGLFI
jgi:hypothetical protein